MTAIEIHEAPKALETQAPKALGASSTTPGSIAELLHFAIEKGVPVETMERLVALQERMLARTAAEDFMRALADFQRGCPSIPHSRKVSYTAAGQKVEYSYAELDAIAEALREPLHSRGFSYGWGPTMADGGMLTKVCTLRHVNGHAESSSFTCPTESRSAMSPQQKYGAAETYAMRRSLISVLGLTTTEKDMDGIGEEVDETTITTDEALQLVEMLEDSGLSRGKFLTYMKAARIDLIRAADRNKAVEAIEEAKRRQAAAAAAS